MQEIIVHLIEEYGYQAAAWLVAALIAWVKRKWDIEKIGQRAADNGINDEEMIRKIVGSRNIKIKIRK